MLCGLSFLSWHRDDSLLEPHHNPFHLAHLVHHLELSCQCKSRTMSDMVHIRAHLKFRMNNGLPTPQHPSVDIFAGLAKLPHLTELRFAYYTPACGAQFLPITAEQVASHSLVVRSVRSLTVVNEYIDLVSVLPALFPALKHLAISPYCDEELLARYRTLANRASIRLRVLPRLCESSRLLGRRRLENAHIRGKNESIFIPKDPKD